MDPQTCLNEILNCILDGQPAVLSAYNEWVRKGGFCAFGIFEVRNQYFYMPVTKIGTKYIYSGRNRFPLANLQHFEKLPHFLNCQWQ